MAAGQGDSGLGLPCRAPTPSAAIRPSPHGGRAGTASPTATGWAAGSPPPTVPLTCLSSTHRLQISPATSSRDQAPRAGGGAQCGSSGAWALRSLPVHLPPLLTRPSPASARARLLRPPVKTAGSPGRSRVPSPLLCLGEGVVWRSSGLWTWGENSQNKGRDGWTKPGRVGRRACVPAGGGGGRSPPGRFPPPRGWFEVAGVEHEGKGNQITADVCFFQRKCVSI